MTPSRPWRTPTLVQAQYVASITARQADVLAGICFGHTNPQIAARLHVTEDCVKTHVKRLLQAMSARSRSHAAALACSEQVVVHVRNDRRRAA